jgi:hypothetical protein
LHGGESTVVEVHVRVGLLMEENHCMPGSSFSGVAGGIGFLCMLLLMDGLDCTIDVDKEIEKDKEKDKEKKNKLATRRILQPKSSNTPP